MNTHGMASRPTSCVAPAPAPVPAERAATLMASVRTWSTSAAGSPAADASVRTSRTKSSTILWPFPAANASAHGRSGSAVNSSASASPRSRFC